MVREVRTIDATGGAAEQFAASCPFAPRTFHPSHSCYTAHMPSAAEPSDSLPRRLRRRCWIATAILLLALTVRVGYLAAQTETAGEYLWMSWKDAVLRWFGAPRPLVTERLPPEQEKFWLSEIDGMFAEQEPTADELMAAAWLLDDPSTAFQWPYHEQYFGKSLNLPRGTVR